MVWLNPKQELDDAIANMEPQWVGETVIAEYTDEALNQLDNMLRSFQRSLSGKFPNLDDEFAFQAKIHEKIDPRLSRQLLQKLTIPIVPCTRLSP